jgi:hypothetical protein
MAVDIDWKAGTITLDRYVELDHSNAITRPLTWGPMRGARARKPQPTVGIAPEGALSARVEAERNKAAAWASLRRFCELRG